MLNKEFPLVSIISPCFNHSNYVIESLDSIRNQAYPNVEHIIVDDCSTDDSVDKIERWIEKYNYQCTFIKHTENKGISFTLNETIALAKGEFWSPLATDDIADPKRTQEFINFFKNNPAFEMVCSDCLMINKDAVPVKKNGSSSFLEYLSEFRKTPVTINNFGSFESLSQSNYIPGSLMIRKSLFDKSGLFDTNLKMEDWDMWLRAASIHRIGFIDEFLTKYRYHDTNTVSSNLFVNAYKEEVLTVLYKSKLYVRDNKYVKDINQAIASHIYFCFSIAELKAKKSFFREKNDLKLYQQIASRIHFEKLKLFFYRQYSKMPDNLLKGLYRKLKKSSK